MVALRTVELIINIVTLSIAYTVSATIAGFVQAWVAKQMGNDTPEQEGFLTLNPLVHIDPVGTICLFLLGIGWSSRVPFEHGHFSSRWGVIAAYLAKPISYLITALIALITLLRIFGMNMLDYTIVMVIYNYLELTTLSAYYPEAPSFVLAIALILIRFVYIGILFAMLDLIIALFKFFITTSLKQFDLSFFQQSVIEFFILLMMMTFFSQPIKHILIFGISVIAKAVAPLVGAL